MKQTSYKDDDTQFEILSYSDKKVVWVDSDRIQECMDYCIKKSLDGVAISPHKNYKKNEIDFLANYQEDISCVIIPSGSDIDISVLTKMDKLQCVSFSGNKQELDFSNSKLEQIYIEWHNKVKLPESSYLLKKLYLMNYKPKIKNLSLLGEYPSLVELSLRQAIINSLEGLNKLKSLNWLQVAHVRNIETLEGLESSSLKCLEIDTCKKITDFEKIVRLHNLEKLILSNCGKIPTLKFISKMKNLKFLSFVNSEIIDGELSYCLGLDYVGFNNKRHYTHTFEQFEK